MEPRKYAEKHECDLNMAFVGYPKTIRPRLCCVQTAQVSRNISLFRFYSSKSFLSVQSFNLNPCIRASAVTYEVTAVKRINGKRGKKDICFVYL